MCLHESSNPGSNHFWSQTEFQSSRKGERKRIGWRGGRREGEREGGRKLRREGGREGGRGGTCRGGEGGTVKRKKGARREKGRVGTTLLYLLVCSLIPRP